MVEKEELIYFLFFALSLENPHMPFQHISIQSNLVGLVAVTLDSSSQHGCLFEGFDYTRSNEIKATELTAQSPNTSFVLCPKQRNSMTHYRVLPGRVAVKSPQIVGLFLLPLFLQLTEQLFLFLARNRSAIWFQIYTES